MKARVYVLCLLALMFFVAPPFVFGLDCPEGSELKRKEDTGTEEVFYCKCVPGRVLIGDHCKVCAAEDQANLIQQHKAAIEGIKASLESLKFEKTQIRQQELLDDLHNMNYKLMQAAMALAVSPDPVKLPTATGLFLVEVTNYLSRVDAVVRKSPDIIATISNIKNFEGIAQKKADAIKTCLTTVQKL